jgi:hypothetical protein|nr:MAG TPA: hypothetical protein [Caudoviricetes sp.]
MTNETKKELTLNQENMIKVSYMFVDKELGDLLEYQFMFIVNNSNINVHMVEYVKAIYKRLRRESKMVIESISNEEIYNSTLAMFNTYVKITEITDELIEKVTVDEKTTEEFKQNIEKFDPLIKDMDKELKEVIKFYKGL